MMQCIQFFKEFLAQQQRQNAHGHWKTFPLRQHDAQDFQGRDLHDVILFVGH